MVDVLGAVDLFSLPHHDLLMGVIVPTWEDINRAARRKFNPFCWLFLYMFLHFLYHRSSTSLFRIAPMAARMSNGAACRSSHNELVVHKYTIKELPKSNVFTSSLPPDPAFKTPRDSHNAPRESLGPRMVKGALFTYVRPETVRDPELLGVSRCAMKDIGLKDGEEESEDFTATVAGNKIDWDEDTQSGIYPWAQCYGGFQFGAWAGQLGDGRAISLFESINPSTRTRYEVQLKGAGKTTYSRFADGKAVLRSSIREFVVSEALNALGIPTTRALSLTLIVSLTGALSAPFFIVHDSRQWRYTLPSTTGTGAEY